jgi:hypothetical protein
MTHETQQTLRQKSLPKLMKRSTGTVLVCALLSSGAAMGQPEPPQAPTAPEPERVQAAAERAERELLRRQERAEAYQETLRQAELEQREALAAMERARVEIERRAEERQRGVERTRSLAENEARRAEELRQVSEQERQAAEAEMVEVQRALQEAHEKMRLASRDVARLHREISRSRVEAVRTRAMVANEYRFVMDSGQRGVIGVILGSSSSDGVEVLGVSPDGPADRAGIRPGDRITAIMGEPLAGDDQDAREVLSEAMVAVDAGDELEVTVLRDGETLDYTLVAEKREPFTFHSYSRLPSAPTPPAPGEPPRVLIERIEVPKIDREALEREMEELHERLDQEFVFEDERVLRIQDGEKDVIIDLGALHDELAPEVLSQFGNDVVNGAGMWFLMPMTQGLKMTALEPALGEYFGAQRGVLVLNVETDNALQLEAGDVILQVGGTAVNSPADVMRALRDLEPDSPVDIDIIRHQREERLTVEVPERRFGLGGFEFDQSFDFRFAHPPLKKPSAQLPRGHARSFRFEE